MSEPKQYAAQRVISTRELAGRPMLPSETLREAEAGLIAELARMVALDGRRFDGWPSITAATDHDPLYLRDSLALRAEVTTR